MRIRTIIIAITLCMAMPMASCGRKEETAHISESVEALDDVEQNTVVPSSENQEINPAVPDGAPDNTTENISSESEVDKTFDNGMDSISEDQAYAAVINYCKATIPDFSDEINTEGFSEYWDVSTNEDGKIVVLYRSYTAAQTRYYIDPITGDTYVTELVPGIIDDEQRIGETFNVREYLIDPGQQDTPTPLENNALAPVEYETADGFMSSFLLSTERDKIDTTNEYGTFYRVIYEASLEGDELIVCGSMDYRNSMAQDSIYISSDLKHIFKVDDNTIYQKGGEESTDTVSKEEFAKLLNERKDSGMFVGVETKNGVVTTAMLFAQ